MDLPPAGDVPYSYSKPDLVAVTHTILALTVNFQDKVLEGKAILRVEKKASTCNELVLDTYKLEILEVKNYRTGGTLWKNMGSDNVNFGNKLVIELPNRASADRAVPSSSKKMKATDNFSYDIQIKYKTSSKSPALYWLEAHQTSDGVHPLLISNSKLTYARAIFPCQDTPSNRIKFSSKVTVPRDFNVMMPGIKRMREENNQVEYTFSRLRNITMAPHEVYIIVGSLREVGNTAYGLRCNLWTERKYLFEGTTAIYKIMVILSTIKQWYNFTDEVNVCVLPPNIPEFDMQYPHVTFVSSTLLEGLTFDKPRYSMIDTIVQNIIESWIGERVRIEHFKDLWLIKGLSIFIHRNPINNIIVDEDAHNFLKIRGIKNVLKMPELQTDFLVPNLTGKLPMNIIKYVSEKGCVFLNYLQHILGDPRDFRRFLVEDLLQLRFTYEFLTTDRFKTFLYECFRHKHETLNTVDWGKWFNEPGFPPSHDFCMSMRTNWHLKADRWVEQREVGHNLIQEVHRTNDLVKIEFLTYLLTLPAVPKHKLDMLRFAFLGDQEICEIRFLWLRLCNKNRNLKLMETLKFASEYCMPKYAYPIYRDLCELDEETRIQARSWFMEPDNRSKMLLETMEELSSILNVEFRSTVDLHNPADVTYDDRVYRVLRR